ncbi:MAG: helix-turn-helix domain-containing protein [Halorhodospira sp.]
MTAPKETLGHLSAETTAELLTAAADIVLVLDDDGVIRDLALGDEETELTLTAPDWMGKRWIDIATDNAHAPITRLLNDHREHGGRATIEHRDAQGGTVFVRYHATPLPAGGWIALGRTLRPGAGGASRQRPRAPHERLRSIEQTTALVGQVPLRDLVREATDLIERMCIETALRATQDNRASAAELLGLSRQSLYSKLRRHGLMTSHQDSS